MTFKVKVLLLVVLVIIVSSVSTYLINKKNLGDEITAENYRRGELKVVDQAKDAAEWFYTQQQSSGMDLSKGPCLTNSLMADWVVDLVHSPRVPEDDLPENQCNTYLAGEHHHLVELDLEGNFVRAK